MDAQDTRPAERVETHHEITAEIRAREAEALTRWQLRRQSTWAVHRRRWTRLGVAGVLILGGLLTVGDVPVLVPTSVAVGLVLVVLADLAGRRRRTLRFFRRILAAQEPPGTPVVAVFTPEAVELTLPAVTHRIPTATITRGTWTDGVLVLDTTGARFYALPDEALGEEAWSLLRRVLGPRLVDLG